MGKMTSAANRLLFGAVNLRLGIWLPRPSLVRLLDNRTKDTQADSHTTWQKNGGLPKEDLSKLNRWILAWQIASWDRVRLHHQKHTEHAWWRPSCWGPAIRWRLWQPNLLLLWREVAGNNPASAKWIYVSDGGHYDNLGLVEALRLHPAQIHLIDASGDAEHKYTGLGQAIALARSELGVQIHLEPNDMELPPPTGQDGHQDLAIPGRPPGILRPFATGTYEYTRGTQAGQTGGIDIIKLGVWAGQELPWDVQAYYASHPTFPRDSTLKQLYDDEDFEAYRELGQASMKALLTYHKNHPGQAGIIRQN